MKLLKWLRAGALLMLLVLALWFASATARGIVAEVGMYYFDDDLVNGGRTLSSAKQFDAANRLRGVENEVLNYHAADANSWFPKGADGEPLHSWMTVALTFGWQGGVTRFVNYSKRWDDPSNRKAFSRRVKDYESPFQRLPRKNSAGYALANVAGNVRVFGPGGVTSEAGFKDGRSTTILAGDAAGNFQPWGKPSVDRDPAVGINQTKAGFGGPWASGGGMMVFADGSVRIMSKDTSLDVLRALSTPAGNEAIPADY